MNPFLLLLLLPDVSSIFDANIFHYELLLFRDKAGKKLITMDKDLFDFALILPSSLNIAFQNGIAGIHMKSKSGKNFWFSLPSSDRLKIGKPILSQNISKLENARARLMTLIELTYPSNFKLTSRSIWELPKLEFDYA